LDYHHCRRRCGSVILPLFNLTQKLCAAHHLRCSYDVLYHQADSLVHDVRAAEDFTTEHGAVARSLFTVFKGLAPQGESKMDNARLLSLQDDIDRQLPNDRFWLPYEDHA
jgi:hypothetical protein